MCPQTASYRVTLKAAQADDPLMKVTTTLTVLVSDVNDHRPTFTPDVINVTVREDALVMQVGRHSCRCTPNLVLPQHIGSLHLLPS